MNKLFPESRRGLRLVVGLAGAATLAIVGILLFRPEAAVLSPEKRRVDVVRAEPPPASERPLSAPEAKAPPAPVDPLESSRKAPPMVKAPPKASAMASTSTPIAASSGAGPDRFAIRDRNVNAFFTDRGVTLALIQPRPGKGPDGYALHWGMDGAAPVEPKATGELPTRINRLVGDQSRWQTDLPSYSSVVYEEVKPGVDLSVDSMPHALKYTVQLASGADPGNLRFHFDGADDVVVSPDGKSVQVICSTGVLEEKALNCWQDGPGGKVPVTAHYQKNGRTGYSIVLDAYDPELPLTVDPIYSWGTYLGGTLSPTGGDDYGYAVYADGSYSSYVAGYTYCADFPTTSGVFQMSHSLTPDAFITKFDPTGALVWSTLLGGSGSDYIQGITLDSSGNIVVAGYTTSSNFPVKNALQPTNPSGNEMGFVTKLNTTGTAIIWSTYLGGTTNSNIINAVALDGNNDVCVTGYTYATDFPLKNPGQATLSSAPDAFCTKILPDGSGLIFSSYLGGNNTDVGTAIACDTSANTYIAGYTYSTNFPTTAGVWSRVNQGSADGFVTKVNSAGVMVWSTMIGGGSYDQITGLCLDNSSPPNPIICGYTYISAPNWPVTGGAFQTVHGASYDGFVTKLSSNGAGLLWSTYLGGSSSDYPMGICTYPGAEVYLAGYTYSTDFPITAGTAFRAANAGAPDGFVTRLSFNGAFQWSTYMGGSSSDYIYACAQSGGWVWVTGNTSSANFPTTPGVWSTALHGSSDTFCCRFNPYLSGASSLLFSTFLGGAHGQGSTYMNANCVALDDSGNTYVAASTYTIDYPGVAGEFQSTFLGTNQNIVVSKIADNGAAPLVWSTYVGGTNYEYANALTINSSGQVYITGYTGSTDFPTVAGDYRTVLNGGEDIFVTCLNADGKSLALSTFLGGTTSSDYAYAIALDSTNNIYVAGYAYSSDFPTTSGVVKSVNLGTASDGFVTKFNPGGTALVYSTLLGGNSGSETITALAVDSNGAAYVTGYTSSTDYPITAGAYSSTFNTTYGDTAFLTKLNPTATAYGYSTFFGGTSGDFPQAVIVDASNQAVVAGYTSSSNFPIVGGFQTLFGGNTDGFVTKFGAAGAAILWSTFLGGSDVDYIFGLAGDDSNNAYVTGYTASANFPMTPPLLTPTYSGNYDAFATRINAGGATLSWSTYIGGSNTDYGEAIAVNSSHNVAVAGYTYSTDFPSTAGAFQTTMNGNSDLFIVRINNEPPSVPTGLAQYDGGGINVIPVGGATATLTVILKGIASDPEGDKYRIQVEVRDCATALVEPATISTFTGPYFESALTAAGTTASVTVTGRVAGTKYHWAARSVDVAGVASPWVSYGGNAENPPTNPAAIDFQIDTTPPTLAISTPISSGTYYTNLTTVALTGTSSDNVQVFNVTWTNSANATNGTASGTTSWSIPSISLAAGTNTITVTASDTAMNTTSQVITVVQDSVPPSVAITSPTTNPTYITAISPLTLSGTVSDNVGVAGVSWSNAANSTNGGATVTSGTWTSTAITLAAGLNNITVKATDLAGNSANVTLGVTYDPNPPTLTITAPTGGTTYSTNLPSVTLSGTASDAITSITKVQYINTTTTAPPPSTASGTASWSTGAIALASGTNVINVTATNAAGTTTTKTLNVIEDTTPPSITISTPTTGSTYITNVSTVTLTGTASDSGGSGLATVTWANPATSGSGTASGTSSWTVSNIGLAQGTNAISVTATDGAGNTSVKTLTVTYDPVPPSVIITTPASTPTYTTNATANLAGTASDNVAVALVEWRNNGAAFASAAGTTTWTVSNVALVAGTNTIDIRATDTAGNTFVKSVVINRDNVPPSISISVPAANPFYTTASTIGMSGTSSDNTGVSLVDYQVNGGGFTAASGTTSWSIAAVSLVAGTNTVNVRATDLAGNTTIASATIIRDNTPPTVAITTNGGANFASNATPLSLAGTASDNFVVSSVTWSNNGGGSNAATGTTAWTASIPLASGSNAIVVTATDAAGNTATASITVTLDQVAPTVTITAPTSAATYYTPTTPLTTLAGTASDNVAVASVQYRVNGGAFTATGGTLSSWNVPSIALSAGSNTVDVKATDTAGNTFTKTLTVILDTTPPSATITSPGSNPAYVTSSPVAVAGTASDNFLVSLVEYSTNGGTTYSPATGTTSWSAPSVVLAAGSNTVTIRVTDGAGNTFVTSTVIILDNQAPTVAITTNGGANFTTNATPLALAGTASDNFLVSQVQWSNNGGSYSATTGTTSWTASIPLVAGTNAIVVRATDGAGNQSTASITVTYSTTAPTVTITSPTSNPSYVTGSSSITLGGTASDTTGIKTIQYRLLPSATYLNATGTTAWTTGVITLSPGSNTIQILATDNASNTATASLSVSYDNQPPNLAITGPTSNPTYATNASTVTLSGTVSANLGASMTSVTWANAGNATNGPANIVGGNWTSASAINLVSGPQVITVTATDSVGNIATKTITVNVDLTAPTVSITNPTSPNIRNTTPVAVTFTASDPGANASGVVSVGWSRAEGGGASGSAVFVSGTTWTANIPLVPGTNTITPTATDAAGNVGTGAILSVNLDQVLPTLAITAPTSNPIYNTNASSIGLSGTVTANGGASVQSVTWTTTGGVVPASGTATLGVGTWTITTVNLAVGSQAISVKVTDTAGNTATQSLTVVCDQTAPSVSITTPTSPNIGNTTPILVTFNASDLGGSGVSTVTWSRAEGGGATGTASFVSGSTWTANVPLVAGTNTITPICTDGAGNVTHGTVLVFTLDQIGPTVAVTIPTATGTFYTNVNTLATLSGTVSANGGSAMSSVSCTNGANSFTTPATLNPGTWSANNPIPLVSGSQVITVTATDSVGNVTTTTLMVIYDNQAPNLLITSPTSDPPNLTFTTGANPMTLGGTASDVGAAGLQSITWSNPAVPASGTATGTSTWSASVPLVGTSSNPITVTATDNAGNATSVTLTVTLNTSAPTVAITSPTTSSTYDTSATTVVLAGTATPAVSATIVKVEYSTDGVTFNLATGTTSWTTPSISLGANPNTITIRATDNSALVGSDTLTVIQDSIKPSISISTNGGLNFPVKSSPVALAGIAADTGGSGLATVTWTNAATSGAGAATGTANWNGSIPLTPGDNLITFTATDGAGNFQGTSITITYDINDPSLAITTPVASGSSYVTGSPTLTTLGGTSSDDIAVGALDYRVNGGAWTSIASPFATWSVPSISLSSGANTIQVRATDTAGNTTTRQIVVTLDDVFPSVAITSPTATPTYITNVTPIILAGSASDNIGVASVTWSNAANSTSGTATGTTSWTATGISLVSGSNAITVKATDGVGNSTSALLTVTYDPVAPTLSITTPSGSTAVTKNTTITVIGTASDNVALAAVTATNAANGSTGTFSGTTAAWTFSGINLVSGLNVISVSATDTAGNSTTKSVSVTCDTVPPAIAITTPTSSGSYLTGSSPLLIGGTASDNVAVASVTWVNSAGGSGAASGTTSWSASVALSAGVNTITVTATDTAGNTQSAIIAVTLATATPNVTITTPSGPAFATNSSPFDLAGTAADATGITSVKWSNAATGGTGVATGTTAWNASVPLAIGGNAITVTATDGAGNTGSALVTITLDTVAPTVAITGPTSAATLITPLNTLALSGTASDNVALASVQWSTTGAVAPSSGLAVLASGTWSLSSNINLAPGIQVITVTATDTAGNTATANLTVTLDTTAPTIAITSPTSAPTYVTGGANLAIGGTAADNIAVASVSWSRVELPAASGTAAGTSSWSATVPLNIGTNTFNFVATDTAGNPSATATIVVTRDTTAPAVQITGPTTLPTWFTNASPLLLSGTATDSDGVASVTWSNAATGGVGTTTYAAPNWDANVPLEVGVNPITVTATDIAGNVSTTTISVTFDVTPPTVSISLPTPAATFVTKNGTVALSGATSDNVGVTSVHWATTGTVVPATGVATLTAGTSWSVPSITLVPGSQVITITAFDASGNSASAVLTVIQNTTAPGIAITGPTSAGSWITNTPTILLSGTSSDTLAVASVTWTNSTGPSGSAVGTTSWNASVPLVAGLNTITVTALNTAGISSSAVIAVTLDATAPTVSITAPTAGATFFTSVAPILLGGSAADNLSVASVTWSNAGTGGTGTATGTTSWTASIPLTSGPNVLTVTSTDIAGNVSAPSVLTVTLDTVPPTVKITGPTTSPSIVTPATTIALSGIASDNVAVQSVTCVNTTNGAVGVVTGTTSWSVAPIALVAGDNTITVTASDQSGNSTSTSITVVQDSVAPTVTITSPTSSGTAFTNASPLSIGGTASDNVALASISWSNPAVPASGTASGTDVWSAAVPLVAGLNTITVTATDTAGNTSTAVLNATLSTTLPTVSTTGPTNQPTYSTASPSVTVSGTAADPVGLTSVTWTNAATGASGTTVGTTSWTTPIALTSGSNLITITATDAAGNISTSTITVIEDNQSPTISVTAPSSAANINSATSPINLGGTASDNVQVAKVTWSNPAAGANGTATGTTAWSASVPLAIGANPITLTAFDEVGNASSRIVTVTYDPAAPTIGITNPTSLPAYMTTQSPLDFAGTAADDLVLASVTWTNTTTAVTGTAAGTSAWTASIPLQQGPNAIVFTATNGIGVTSTASITVTLDNTPPVVTIVTPPPPTLTTQVRPLVISGTAVDDTGVSRVGWSNSLTGASGTCTFSDPNWTASIQLIPGTNVITIKASDLLGNIGSSTLTVNFSFETIPPVLAIDPSLLPSFVSPSQLATVFGTASDDMSVTSVTWVNKTTGVFGVATGTSTWTTTVPLTTGNNLITVTASDDAGNLTSQDVTASFSAAAQTNPPSVTITGPTTSATFTTTSSPLNLQATAIDAVGVVSVTWSNQATFGTGSCGWGANWFASIPLANGLNPITVTATDTSGLTGTATIAITYNPPVGDPVPPTVAFVTPAAGGTVNVGVPTVDITGTAYDNVSVVSVTYSNSATGLGATVAGTASWSMAGIQLNAGVNVLTARALDPSGNVGETTLVVVYTPPAAAKPVAPKIPAGMCGCTGLEVLVGLGLVWIGRRARRRAR